MNDKDFLYKSIVRNRKEFIRVADEAVVAMMEADSITPPKPRASGDRSNESRDDVPECHNSGGEVMASSAWL